MNRIAIAVLISVFVPRMALADAPDIVVADFEGSDFGDWKVKGEAFSAGPAHDKIGIQRQVSGFEGKGFASSMHGGEKAQGTLTSPKLKIERKFLNFLLGGGNKPGKACMNLLVSGRVVRTATGMNEETLTWHTWDVGPWLGKEVQIEVVDRAIDKWGHISVDQIIQSDHPAVTAAPLYQERYRPQFHFTAQRNWLNDPNGLVFYEGEYHLFFQHNPDGINWGNMTWGHAVSPDLFRWEQLEHAIFPDSLGTIFSGSAVIDWNNTAGFQQGDEKTIVCIYTSAGGSSDASKGRPFTQSLAFSVDRGRTWQKYEHNPVLPHVANGNRDPKVFWHAGTRRWIMALFLENESYALFGSPDLKNWSKLCDIPALGSGECPDMFELPIEGDGHQTRWIFWGGNNNYLIGTFDGKIFRKESGPHRFEFGANYYAAQTYSDVPDGRRIQIAWMSGGKYPDMPFNQQMSLPSELRLKKLPDGLLLCRQPVKEFAALRGEPQKRSGLLSPAAKGSPGANLLDGIQGDLIDLRADIDVGRAERIGIKLRGKTVHYTVARQELSCAGKTAPLPLRDGHLRLEIVLDRSSLEVFADEGQVTMSFCFLPPENDKSMSIEVTGGPAQARSVEVWPIKSAWPGM